MYRSNFSILEAGTRTLSNYTPGTLAIKFPQKIGLANFGTVSFEDAKYIRC